MLLLAYITSMNTINYGDVIMKIYSEVKHNIDRIVNTNDTVEIRKTNWFVSLTPKEFDNLGFVILEPTMKTTSKRDCAQLNTLLFFMVSSDPEVIVLESWNHETSMKLYEKIIKEGGASW